MAYPGCSVEIAFDDGPYVAIPTWTDIRSYVRSVSISRGRDSDASNFEAGTATVVLDNRDRRFDPFYTAGPYYGKLLPRRQILIRGEPPGSVGTGRAIFRGYVSGWPVELSESGYDSTVTLSCFDLQGLMAEEELPDDLSGDYILNTLTPRHYWPLDDPLNPANNSTLELKDYGSTPMPLRAPTSYVGNAAGLAAGISDTCLVIASGNVVDVAGTLPNAPTAGAMSVALWWQQTAPDITPVIFQADLGRVIETTYDPTTNDLEVSVYDGTNVRLYRNAAVYLDVTVPHHLAVSQPSTFTTTPTVWVDGLEVAMTFISSTASAITLGESFTLLNGRFQSAAVFAATLTTTQVRTIYNLAANRVLESTSERFTRIMGYSSVPAALYGFSGTASYEVFEIGAGGPPIVQELQLLADSEGGNLWFTRGGVLRLTSRNSIFSGDSITSQASFGGTGITVEPILRYRYDDDSIINDVTVGYSGDGGVTVQDATSISTYGQKSASIPTYLSTADQADDLADLLVGFSSDPKIALDGFRVNVDADSADWDTILQLDLLDRITVTIQQRTGANITVPQLIQAIDYQIVPGRWDMTITGTTRFTNPFILDSSLLDGDDLII